MTDAPKYTPIPLPDRFDYTDEETRFHALSFMNFMRKRHTVRDYSDRDVDRGVIEDCIAAAGTAPDRCALADRGLCRTLWPARGRREVQELLRARKRWYCYRISAGCPASRRSGQSDPHAESDEIPE